MTGDPSTQAGRPPRNGAPLPSQAPLTRPAPLTSLDGAALWRWARLVAARLDRLRGELDALNVFPVPDGDTGTNLHLTVAGALADDPGDLARALLVHARGSSGVIASQLVRGWVDVLGARGRDTGSVVTGPVLAKALRRGDELAWAALTDPVEGTVLSVSRAAADAAERVAGLGATLHEVVQAVAAAAEQALDRTPLQLPALAAAGVVDAGGAGLVVTLRALRDVVAGTADDSDDADDTDGADDADGADGAGTPEEVRMSLLGVAGVDLDPDGPAYEVMYLLATPTDGPDQPGEQLRRTLSALGDSVLVVGGDGLFHIHVHTDDPGGAVEAGLALGRARSIRITHFEAAARAAGRSSGPGPQPGALPAAALAVVACAGGAATQALCGEAGATVVPSAPGTRASTGDVLAALLRTGARAQRVLVLPNDAETAAVAHQAALAAEEQGVTAVVARSRSQVQVLAALAVLGGDVPAGTDVPAALRSAAAAVEGCRHGAVAVAARDSDTPAGPCRTGDVVGTVAREVVAVGTDAVVVAAQVVRHLGGANAELVTVLPGEGDGVGVAAGLRARLLAERSDLQVDLVGGGQPRYLLLLGCE